MDSNRFTLRDTEDERILSRREISVTDHHSNTQDRERFETIRRRERDPRSYEDIKLHYDIEKELATRLRQASKEERRTLYNALYDEAYRRIPRHPTRKDDPAVRADNVARQLSLLKPFLRPDAVFLEIGPGHSCSLSLEVCKYVKTVYAMDVSAEISKTAEVPANFESVIFDGCSVPMPAESVDIAFTNQVMEHLVPEDALEQVAGIYRALVPGGLYICTVPSRLLGPTDVSKYFDKVATCFHMKEYTYREIEEIFRNAGFRKIRAFVGAKATNVLAPLFPIRLIEDMVRLLPESAQSVVCFKQPLRSLLNIKVVATK